MVFRSGEKGIDDPNDNTNDGSFLSDFGQNRKRMESIRKRGVVFDVMGSGFNMDTYYGSSQGMCFLVIKLKLKFYLIFE